MSDTLVIYHASCWDGFCAAWLMWKKFPQAEFVPANYGDDPPAKVQGRHVYILDFSYPRETLEQIYREAASLVVLDHHKTAREELADLPFCLFDESKSGARLTHEYIDRAIDGVTGEQETPSHWLVDYTEDRDLWRWELPFSREINTWLRSHRLSFELWNELEDVEYYDDDFKRFIGEGEAILRCIQQTIDSEVEHSHLVEVARPQKSIDEGLPFWPSWRVANATTLISETAHALAMDTGVGCCWFELATGERVYSLRASPDSNVDVSEIAKAYGGGGHPKASGFRSSVHPWASTSN